MTTTPSRPAPAPDAAPPASPAASAVASSAASPAPSRAPSTDAWHWGVTGAGLLAVLAAATSLNGVVEPWSWLMPALGTLVPVLLAMAVTRTLRRGGVVTALVGVLALAGSLTAQFLPHRSIIGVLPGPGSVLELQHLLAQAEETVVSQVAPVLPNSGISLIVCAALGLIAIVVDLFATTLRMPAASGMALIAVMISPAVVKPAGVGLPAFVATVLAFLLLLAVGQWRENRLASGGARASSGFAGRGAIIGAAALAVTLILPVFVPGFTSGAFPQGARLSLWGNATGLNPAVTLGNDLRNPTGFGRISYSTNSDAPLYLRAVTLEDFGGQRWEPDERTDDRQPGVAELGAEAGAPGAAADAERIFTRITTQSYASPWLLSPYAPVGVSDLAGSWSWDPATLSILATDGGSTAQQEYLVESRSADLTREQLGAIGPSAAGSVPEVFTDLPDDTPGIIRTRSEEITGGFVNPYDKAMAIQNYLRGPEFAYSEEAPVDGGYDGSGMDVMARFLEAKSGYCVHYAGTMAVLARAAGIPSRMAVGYTPGTPTGGTEEGPAGTELNEFAVDSRNAHAWPELYFEGAGWVRFEPTPSRGVVPTYAQRAFAPVGPRADESDALDPRARSGAGGQADAATEPPSDAPGTEGGGASEPGDRATPGAGLAAIGGLGLLALVPLLLRTARTRSRRRTVVAAGTATGAPSGADGGALPGALPGTDGAATAALSGVDGAATAAWAETTELAGDHGHPLRVADTPRTFATRLAHEADLTGDAASALARLRNAYEHAEYAERRHPATSVRVGAPHEGPGGVGSALARPGPPRWDDVHAVTRALRSGSSWPTRIRARLFPQSLLHRFRSGSRRW